MIILKGKKNWVKNSVINLKRKGKYGTKVQIKKEFYAGIPVLVESFFDSKNDFVSFDILPRNWNKEYIIKRLEKHFNEPVGIIS